MTLESVKALLASNGIPYEICLYADEAEFWRHICMFPSRNAKPFAVTVIVIRSKNGHKDIELEFCGTGNHAGFIDLFFGDYTFELLGSKEELLPLELLQNVNEILQGEIKIIVAYDLKKEHWLWDACYDNEDTDYAQSPYNRAIDRINKPCSLFEKLRRSKKLYEIYDYDNYQCITKG